MIINLVWKGPQPYGEVITQDDDTDYGVYQVYGIHPVYGADTLLYIGKANDNTFGARFRSADKLFMNDANEPWGNNVNALRIHTGRIHLHGGERRPAEYMWSRWVTRAERLLIHAHSPAWNAQNVSPEKGPPNGRVYRDLHVLNWGQFGQLLPEVSGARLVRGAVFERLWDEPLTLE